MSDLPEALCNVIDEWASLSEAVEVSILAMVKAARPQ
jgi:hypothetical protein